MVKPIIGQCDVYKLNAYDLTFEARVFLLNNEKSMAILSCRLLSFNAPVHNNHRDYHCNLCIQYRKSIAIDCHT